MVVDGAAAGVTGMAVGVGAVDMAGAVAGVAAGTGAGMVVVGTVN